MERIDISDDPRWTALVEAAERGEEAAIVRDGRVVVEVKPVVEPREERTGKLDIAKLEELHAKHGLTVEDAGTLVSEMRDMDLR